MPDVRSASAGSGKDRTAVRRTKLVGAEACDQTPGGKGRADDETAVITKTSTTTKTPFLISGERMVCRL